jgi:hypothetical protein
MKNKLLNPEDGGSTLLRNIGNFNCATQFRKIPQRKTAWKSVERFYNCDRHRETDTAIGRSKFSTWTQIRLRIQFEPRRQHTSSSCLVEIFAVIYGTKWHSYYLRAKFQANGCSIHSYHCNVQCKHSLCLQYFTNKRHATFNAFWSLPLCGILFSFQGHGCYPSVINSQLYHAGIHWNSASQPGVHKLNGSSVEHKVSFPVRLFLSSFFVITANKVIVL